MSSSDDKARIKQVGKLNPAKAFLSGGGEMGARMRAYDWAATPLGDPEDWPETLRTMVSVILNSALHGGILWGPELRLLYNDAYAPSLGDRHPEALSRPIADVWGPVWDQVAPQFLGVMATGEPLFDRELPLTIEKNGRDELTHWSHGASAIRCPNGRVVGLLTQAIEITLEVRAKRERAEAEDRLNELNKTLEEQVAARTADRNRLWQLSTDVMLVTDMEGVIEAINPAWTHLLGWSEADLIGKPFLDYVHPDDIESSVAVVAGIHVGETFAHYSNRYRHKDGSYRDILWTAGPGDGKMLGVGRDATEQKARERALAAAEDALRQSQKMDAIGQLTGGVAHDFNNLLTPIVGSLDMLQRKGVGGEREQRLIAGAVQSAERAKTLVQRLLAFSRRQPLQPVPVNVAELVSGMAALVSSTTGPQIRVVVDAAEGLPSAKADPNQLEMALLNLSVNARDAMPNGGTLRITAVADKVEPEDVSGLKPGRYVKLSVADTGIGMDDATVARAVEPFFSTKGVGKGTGLGLSMVHGLALQLGGTLTIKSQPDLGTNIELWLPVTDAPAESAGAVAQAVEAGSNAGTALLVDDEELVRISTADMLNDLGYTVVEANSAEEALQLIHGGLRPNLLVTDHLMPGMNGTDLARIVLSERPDTSILLVSGYAEAEGVAPDLPRLTKPFRIDELAASLAQLRIQI